MKRTMYGSPRRTRREPASGRHTRRPPPTRRPCSRSSSADRVSEDRRRLVGVRPQPSPRSPGDSADRRDRPRVRAERARNRSSRTDVRARAGPSTRWEARTARASGPRATRSDAFGGKVSGRPSGEDAWPDIKRLVLDRGSWLKLNMSSDNTDVQFPESLGARASSDHPLPGAALQPHFPDVDHARLTAMVETSRCGSGNCHARETPSRPRRRSSTSSSRSSTGWPSAPTPRSSPKTTTRWPRGSTRSS